MELIPIAQSIQDARHEWFITYQGPKISPPGTPHYVCNQLVCSVKEFLRLLSQQNNPPYTEHISAIQATTIHSTPCLMKDISKGAEIVMYVGFVDFDAYAPGGMNTFEFKQSLQQSFDAGLTFEQVCGKHPTIRDCMKAAALLCQKLQAMGISPTCWWTGRKGFRVVWKDLPRCFLRCKAGDRRIPLNIVNVFFRDYVGGAVHDEITALTFWCVRGRVYWYVGV